MNKKRIAILLLAGKSERFLRDGNQIKKQFYPIQGIPLFLYPLISLLSSGLFEKILLVHEEEDRALIIKYLDENKIDGANLILIPGGKDRNESVYHALRYLKENKKENENIALFIHDAARACLPLSILMRLDALADQYDAITPVIPVSDSLIRENAYVPRENLYRVQTPQVLDFSSLCQAYACESIESKTDDYSKVLALGGKTTMIEGDNILFKVTYPQDLKIMEKLIAK